MTPHPHLLGPVRQLGHIVRDLDRTIADWLAIGIGPWFVIARDLPQEVTYRGEPCTTRISIALANTGDLQIELVQQTLAGPSIYTEFLAAGKEGLHQLAWWPADYDAALAAAGEAGWSPVWSSVGSSTRFGYFETPASPTTVLELTESTPSMLGMSALVREAARDWDGTDPVRSLG
jgi:hypothetical protein